MRFILLFLILKGLVAAQDDGGTHSLIRGQRGVRERSLKGGGKKQSSYNSGSKKQSSFSDKSSGGKKSYGGVSSGGKKGSGSKKSGGGRYDVEALFLVTVIARYDNISTQDYVLLEDEFQDTYNDLTSARYVEDVSIRPPEELDVTNFNITRTNNDSVTFAETLIYDVRADCQRDCGRPIMLTKPGPTPPSPITPSPAAVTSTRRHKGSHGGKKGSPGDDDDIDNESGSSSLPTERELQRAYNENVQEFIQKQHLNSVAAVSQVAELRRVECRGDLNELGAIVDVTFIGDTFLLPELDQLQILSQVFRRTYQELSLFNPQTCDTAFRTVTSARTGGQAQRGRNLQTMVEEFTARFTMNYACIACSDGTPLFDNATVSARLLQDSDDDDDDYVYSKSGKKGAGKKGSDRGDDDDDDDSPPGFPTTSPTDANSGIECVCPINAIYFRAPTTDEFLPAFDNNIRILTELGIIDYVNQVILVEEIGPTSTTISAPTASDNSLRTSNRNSDAEPLQFSNINLDAFENEMKEITRRPRRNHRHGDKL